MKEMLTLFLSTHNCILCLFFKIVELVDKKMSRKKRHVTSFEENLLTY